MTSAAHGDDIVYGDQRSALIIGEGAGARDAAAAAGHADLRVVGSVGLADAGPFLARSIAPEMILVEAGTADADAADAALATVDTIARERGIDVVVALNLDQVDLVASQLFGRHVQLLCDPSVADRIAALRWASGLRGQGLHDSTRDADERLRRLNDEVARFADTLAQLAAERDRPRIGQIRDRSLAFRAEQPAAPAIVTDPVEVRDVIRARRMRAAYLPAELFADPAWDMLLDLFAAELEHRRVSVSSLCIAAAVPGTTALRWIGSMVETKLFERYADPHDRRRAFISLSGTAREGMQRYFDAVRRAGLAPA